MMGWLAIRSQQRHDSSLKRLPLRGTVRRWSTLLPRKKVRLWDRRLTPHERLLRGALLILCAAILLLFLIPAGQWVVSLWTASGSHDLPSRAEVDDSVFPNTRFREFGVDPPAPSRSAIPHVEWSTPELLRRAASVLLLQGRYRSAIELLRQEDIDRQLLLGISDRQHEEALAAFQEALLTEHDRLVRFWKSLPAARRVAYHTDNFLARRRFTAMLESKLGVATLRDWRENVPESLLVRFAANVHCELRDRTRSPDAYLKLLVESCFPPDSSARKLYMETDSFWFRPYP